MNLNILKQGCEHLKDLHKAWFLNVFAAEVRPWQWEVLGHGQLSGSAVFGGTQTRMRTAWKWRRRSSTGPVKDLLAWGHKPL